MLNKSYKDNLTGEVFKVIDIYENIAITDKKNKIDARRLYDERFYTEYIDPKSFFSSDSTYSAFADKINSIDLSKVPEDLDVNESISVKIEGMDPSFIPSSSESAAVIYDPEDEKRELMKKYNIQDNSDLERQNNAFSKLLEDPKKDVPISNVSISNVQKERNYTEIKEDPIITMFRNVKRKEKFSIDIKVEGLIPRFDFIEMMEDSYETSIIEFLADEMVEKILSDPQSIKSKIVNEIKSKIGGISENEIEKEEEVEKPKRVYKKRIKKTENINDQ
jgi:hypothetical protein